MLLRKSLLCTFFHVWLNILLYLNQVFQANIDKYTVVRAKLSNTILARYIRIYPITWRDKLALRVEFIGAYVGECLQYKFASRCLDKVDLDSFQLASTAAVVVVSAIIAVFVVIFIERITIAIFKE